MKSIFIQNLILLGRYVHICVCVYMYTGLVCMYNWVCIFMFWGRRSPVPFVNKAEVIQADGMLGAVPELPPAFTLARTGWHPGQPGTPGKDLENWFQYFLSSW